MERHKIREFIWMEVASVNVCVSEYLFKEFPINYDNFIWLVLCCDGGKAPAFFLTNTFRSSHGRSIRSGIWDRIW